MTPAAWVTGDEVYGNSPGLRADLEARQLGYALAVARDHRVGFGWAFVRLDHHSPPPAGRAGRHWLLVRRNRRSGELAFYRCHTPHPTPLAVLVRIAGRPRRIEEAFQASTAPATTDDKPHGTHEDHDRRLQYQAPPRPRPGAPGIARVD